MKKVLKLTATVLALVFMLSMSITAVAATTYGYIVTKDANGSVRVRKSASSTASIVTELKNGTKVEVLGKSGDYTKVKSGSKTGYVLSSYVSSKAPTSTSTSSSTKRTGVTTKSTKVYKTAKSSSSNVLMSIASGKSFTILGSTTSFYKVSYSGKTGYILKSAAKETTQTSTSTKTATPTSSARPGDAVDAYKSNEITKPADIVSDKAGLYNAINYNLINLNESFTVKVKNFNTSMIPRTMSALERSFTSGSIQLDDISNADSDKVTTIKFKVAYNEAGKVLQALKKGKTLSSDSKVQALKKEVDAVVSAVKGKSDYEKILYIHDLIVKNTAYDEKMSKESYSAYGVMVKKLGSCQGYAETVALLATACDIENRFVWANSKITKTGSHGFNKVKIDGKWYNVDATVDDPAPNKAGRVKHDYLLVTDKVSAQRYKWDTNRYPASSTDNNWHKRNGLVATSQSELEKIVKAGVAKKEKYISVWVTDYSASKYKTAFAKSLSGAKYVGATTTPASSEYSTFQTSIFFEFSY